MRSTLGLAALLLLASSSRADTVKVLTQEIKADSVLTLRNDVAEDFAENLLAAQAASPWLNSLNLSLAAVLKAIRLEQSFGTRYCDDGNCAIVWQQSNIAIDPNAGVTITPSALYFGAEPVSTPEPMTDVLLVVGVLYFLALGTRRTASREYPGNHPFRK